MLVTSDAIYVMLAEFGIFLVAAAGLLQAKASGGTLPVLYTAYVLGTGGAALLLAVVLGCVRLRMQHARLDGALRAGVHFQLALTSVFMAYLVLAAEGGSCDKPLEALLLQARLQDSEGAWMRQTGVVAGVALGLVQGLLAFFIGSAAHEDTDTSPAGPPAPAPPPPPPPPAPTQVYRLVWTAVVLGQFTQLTLHVQLRALCAHAPTDCTGEGLEPLQRLGSAAVWVKYRAAVLQTAVLLAVDVLDVAMHALMLALRVFRALTGRGPWHPDAALLARLQRDLVLLGCAWPVAAFWWLRGHQHDLECARVFRAYNTAMAVLLSASAGWLALSVLRPEAKRPEAKRPEQGTAVPGPDLLRPRLNARFSAGKAQATANFGPSFLHRDTACFIGTQQARMHAEGKGKTKVS
jgi:hypothetical protein